MAISETILGRLDSRSALSRGKPFTVSVYDTRHGKTFYTGPINSDAPPKPSVRYRIVVRPKRRFSK